MNPEVQKPSDHCPPQAAVNFVHELGQLSVVDRSGWERLGIKPEKLSAHVLRAAQIAYVLAVQEGHPDPHYVVTLAVFHEIAEIRTGDPNAISKKYIVADELKAVRDQTAGLGAMGVAIFEMWKEVETRSTPAGVIAKDADRLEMAFRARELIKQGHADAAEWLNVDLRTNSARALHAALMQGDPHDWWKNLTSADVTPKRA